MNISHLFILLTLSFVFLTNCASNAVKNNDEIGVFWKVEKAGVKSSYVLGTVHSEDERVLKLPANVNTAFDQANTFAMELVLNDETKKIILEGMYFTDGRTLKNLLSEKTYQKTISEMEKRDLPEEFVNRMKPWAVFTFLNMPEQETGLFLDAVLYLKAVEQNKKVIGLESAQEQLSVFDDMKIQTQITLLESTFESDEELKEILNKTIEIYLAKDLKKMQQLNDKYLSKLDKNIADEFNQRLIIDRNKRMFRRMTPLISEGNAFIAIGALHLPGRIGVLNLLRQDGYTVTTD